MCGSDLCKASTLSRLPARAATAGIIPVTDARLVVLDGRELAALRREVVRRAAELRPGHGHLNVGLTPRWYRDKCATLDALRARLAAAEGVRP